MKKVAIVYHSAHGHTEHIAGGHFAATLGQLDLGSGRGSTTLPAACPSAAC